MKSRERQQLVTSKQVKICCIVPMYNEEKNIERFIAELQKKLINMANKFKIIVVDDGSKDRSTEKITKLIEKDSCIGLLQLSRNFGKEIALTAGLDNCPTNYDVIFLLDSDFQHPLELLPKFLTEWANGYDMVYGIRTNREHESKIKRIFTKLFYASMQRVTKIDIVANAGDFRLLDKKVVQALNLCTERNRFMKGLYSWVGYKSLGIPYTAAPRWQGKSSWHFKNLFELAITGITSFSDIPLRFWSLFGLVIAGCSFAYAIYTVIITLVYGVVLPGYASIMVAIFFFGGVQLCSIGVLGEYIARIFNEVKKRPKYILENKVGFD